MHSRRIPMSSQRDRHPWTRRDVLKAGLAAAGTASLAYPSVAQPKPAEASEGEKPYGPFKMGLQSYSLRGLTSGGKSDRKKALAATKELGLHYWESYIAHVPLT